MKLAIIAGGKGIRLALKNIPKPMVQIGKNPLLAHQINLAKQYGIQEIYILSGYLSDVIKDYFGDGSAFGIKITHVIEKYPLGTAGAVRQLEGIINERFMVFYGDIFFDMDLKGFMEFDSIVNSIATITVHPNEHPYDSDLLEVNDDNIVTAFHAKPHIKNTHYRNLVNAAIYILSPEIFRYIPQDKPSDFGKDIFPFLIKSGETIRVYKTPEYIKDIGDINRLQNVTSDFLANRVERFSKRNRRPGIFLDRDGTLAKKIDLLHREGELELYPFVASAIKEINNSDYLCFLITNQPVVARNLCDISTVKKIHNKLETLLGKEGAYLNDIYFCPHHMEKGYPEENPFFKVNCECRKPKTSMIDKAVEEYNIDKQSSWIIGDTTTDIQTGINAGMRTILVYSGDGGKDEKFKISPDFIFDNVKDAVNFILNGRKRYGEVAGRIINRMTAKGRKLSYIIAVGGHARSGKTNFVNFLRGYFSENNIPCDVINLDNWIVGADQRSDLMTVRDRYRYKDIERDINRLLSGEHILMNEYDAYSRMIVKKSRYSLNYNDCIIIVGVPALDIKYLRNKSDIRIYMEVDEKVRKERFFTFYKWKDMAEDYIAALYKKRMKDEGNIVEDSRKYADFIVNN